MKKSWERVKEEYFDFLPCHPGERKRSERERLCVCVCVRACECV